MDATQYRIRLVRAEQFPKLLERSFFETEMRLDAEVFATDERLQPSTWENLDKSQFIPVKEGDVWGKLWMSGYFHLSVVIPPEWRNQDLWLNLEMGGEILLENSRFEALTALTNTCIQVENFRKTLWPLDEIPPDGKLQLFAEVGCNGFADSGEGDLGVCRSLRFGPFRREVWQLRNDYSTVLSILHVHETDPWKATGGWHSAPREMRGPHDHRAARILFILEKCIAAYRENPQNAAKARRILREVLDSPAQSSEMNVSAVGHGHLDIGYLWPIAETERKACRTFAGQLGNLKHYPDYVFGASQPQLYQFVKDRMPDVYRSVKRFVSEGRWEPQGGMWVEADCNLPDSESLIRQFLHGKNFFMDEFGFDVRNAWLPDSFGYSAVLPQIMKQVGCEYLVAQKLSWNENTQFPYNIFLWRGVGPGEVCAHFGEGYNSNLSPESLRYVEDHLMENDRLNRFLILFGAGDGGGGPKMEHIEAGRRVANLEDVPRVRFEKASDALPVIFEQKELLDTFYGELYLELHRGTYTAQSKLKRIHRKLEELLRETESVLALTPEISKSAREDMDSFWKVFLMSEFHDILPGTSIASATADILNRLSNVKTGLETLLPHGSDKDFATVINTLPVEYDALIRLPESWRGSAVCVKDGTPVAIQEDEDGMWASCPISGLSSLILHREPAREASVKAEKREDLVLENELILCKFHPDGRVYSCFDKKHKREVLAAEGGNLIKLWIDRARNFDAWEVECTYRLIPPETPVVTAPPEIICGELRSRIRFSLKIGKSAIVQTVELARNSTSLKFSTIVDWHESHKMLRTRFATVLTDDVKVYASCGHAWLDRSCTPSSIQALAHFEFPARNFVAVSDGVSTAALLNDCKYGYSASKGAVELDLLRAPEFPDGETDMGMQEFTYEFRIADSAFNESGIIENGWKLNRSPLILEGVAGIPEFPFAMPENSGIAVLAFKFAEKNDDRILRLAETHGRTCTMRLRISDGWELRSCDLLEWQSGEAIPSVDGGAELRFAPFEIRTFRLIKR